MKKKTFTGIAGIFMFAAVSKSYGVGDTVYVWFHDSYTLQALPQSRVVRNVNVIAGTNEATVEFTTGEKVTDGATQRVFTTQALCAAAIISDTISRFDACAVLDTGTTSGASTAGQPTLGLVRSSA